MNLIYNFFEVKKMYYQRLKDMREDNDMSQRQVANLLNITQQQYSLYENGTREIKTHLLKALAIYYNVSADYLLGIIDEPRKIK